MLSSRTLLLVGVTLLSAAAVISAQDRGGNQMSNSNNNSGPGTGGSQGGQGGMRGQNGMGTVPNPYGGINHFTDDNAHSNSNDRSDDNSNGSDAAESAHPATLSDVRENFPTVIGTYIAAHSGEDGYWRIVADGKKLKVKLDSVDKDSVSARGRSLYTAKARLAVAGKGRRAVTVYFTADFSGSDWHVVSHSLKPTSRKR